MFSLERFDLIFAIYCTRAIKGNGVLERFITVLLANDLAAEGNHLMTDEKTRLTSGEKDRFHDLED